MIEMILSIFVGAQPLPPLSPDVSATPMWVVIAETEGTAVFPAFSFDHKETR